MNIDEELDKIEKTQKEISKISLEEISKMKPYEQSYYAYHGSGPSIIYILPIARLIGPKATALLGALISIERNYKKENKLSEDGFFILNKEQIDDLQLSPFQIRNFSKKLKNHNFIEIKYKGMPAKKYFKINRKTIEGFTND
jgi:hypothetical protein